MVQILRKIDAEIIASVVAQRWRQIVRSTQINGIRAKETDYEKTMAQFLLLYRLSCP